MLFGIIDKLSFSLLIFFTIITFFKVGSASEILDSFSRDPFSNFFKILILVSSLFVLNTSKNYIVDNNLNKFEYPIIILIAILAK